MDNKFKPKSSLKPQAKKDPFEFDVMRCQSLKLMGEPGEDLVGYYDDLQADFKNYVAKLLKWSLVPHCYDDNGVPRDKMDTDV